MIGLFITIFFSVIYVLSAYTDEENEESLLDLMLKVTPFPMLVSGVEYYFQLELMNTSEDKKFLDLVIQSFDYHQRAFPYTVLFASLVILCIVLIILDQIRARSEDKQDDQNDDVFY